MGYLSKESLTQELSLAKEEVSLTTPLMSTMVRAGLEDDLKKKIADSIVACCYSLGIDMPTTALKIFIDDIIEVYGNDSICDVLTGLKYIRTGVLGTTYNKLNMIALRESMAIVLEDKARQREEAHQKVKKAGTEINVKIDYEAYKLRQSQEKKEEKKESLSQMQYNELKHQYFNNKKD